MDDEGQISVTKTSPVKIKRTEISLSTDKYMYIEKTGLQQRSSVSMRKKQTFRKVCISYTCLRNQFTIFKSQSLHQILLTVDVCYMPMRVWRYLVNVVKSCNIRLRRYFLPAWVLRLNACFGRDAQPSRCTFLAVSAIRAVRAPDIVISCSDIKSRPRCSKGC